MQTKLLIVLITSILVITSCGSAAKLRRTVDTSSKDYQAINRVLKAKKGGKIILKETYVLDPSIHREIDVDQLLYISENDSLFYKVTADGKLTGKPLSTISKIGVDKKFGFGSNTAIYVLAMAAGIALTLAVEKDNRQNRDNISNLGAYRTPIYTIYGIGITVGLLAIANLLNSSAEPRNYVFYSVE